MTLDADLVRSRCGEIEESVVRLERLARLTRSDLLGDQDSLDIACYRLLVVIEAALALCHHVSARHLRRVPEDYAACFAILQEGGLIPADLSDRLQQMARFRNLLVHIYGKIDCGQVYGMRTPSCVFRKYTNPPPVWSDGTYAFRYIRSIASNSKVT